MPRCVAAVCVAGALLMAARPCGAQSAVAFQGGMGSRPAVVFLGFQGHAGSTARFRFEANAGLGSETLFLWGLAGLVGLPAVGAWRPVLGLGSSAIVGTGVGLNGGPRAIVVVDPGTRDERRISRARTSLRPLP